MVTCDGSNGLIRARDSKGGEPSEPITIRTGGESSRSSVCGETTGLTAAEGIAIGWDLEGEGVKVFFGKTIIEVLKY